MVNGFDHIPLMHLEMMAIPYLCTIVRAPLTPTTKWRIYKQDNLE
jgi:hypothetical protein